MPLIVCSLLVAGCSRAYQQPLIYAATDHSDGPSVSADFDGIVDLLSPDRPAQVFWTHGICPKGPDWAKGRLDALAAALSPDGSAIASNIVVTPVADTGAYIGRGSVAVPERGQVVVTFLLWSDIVEPYRRHIAESGNAALIRARLNKVLEDVLMNKCLVDAVVYSGRNGDPIRRAAWMAVCEFMGGTAENENCRFAASEMPNTALISESIGSKILIDALNYLSSQPGNLAASSEARSKLRQLMDNVSTVYLLANQVPILDTANMELDALGSAGAGGLATYGNLLVAPGPLGLPKLTIVAFTDPNDLLGYAIPEAGPPGTRVINVIVSNDWTYLGYVERPDTAHCGYKTNPVVLELTAQGYRAGEARKFGWASADNACLGG